VDIKREAGGREGDIEKERERERESKKRHIQTHIHSHRHTLYTHSLTHTHTKKGSIPNVRQQAFVFAQIIIGSGQPNQPTKRPSFFPSKVHRFRHQFLMRPYFECMTSFLNNPYESNVLKTTFHPDNLVVDK